MAYRMRERQLNEWWREKGEDKIVAKELRESKMKEFELKAGSDGKDTPDIKKMYAKNTSADFGKKGVNEKKVVTKKKVQEEFEDELEDQDLDMDADVGGDLDDDMGMDDVNMESDIPADVTDPEMLDSEGSDVDVSDITITIGGKSYSLVSADEGRGEEDFGDEEFGDDMGDEDFDSEGMDGEDIDVNSEAAEMDANAEDEDITYQESRKILKKKIKEMDEEGVDDSFYDEVLESAIKAVKEKRRKESVGSERKSKTASFSSNGDAKDGTTAIGKDHSFAKKGETKSGSKYTPSKSDSVYEARAKRKAEFKAWLEKQEDSKKRVSEEVDPFEDDITPDETIGDDFANMPTEIGADPKVIEKYNATKANRNKRRQEAVEQDPKFPNKDVKEDVEGSLKESFDFKKLVRGEY